MKDKIKSLVEIIIIITLFVFFSWLVQNNLFFFKNLLGEDINGMLIYIFIIIVSIVIAPISTIVLLPVASNLWGEFLTAILSIIGWTVGAYIAFVIARKYGVSIIKKFISIEKINNLEKRIPKENVFWSVVFLRIVIPVDVLSYALGLFSKIKTKSYILATLIGIIPFAFIFAYFGKIPIQYQLIIFAITLVIITTGFALKNKKPRKN